MIHIAICDDNPVHLRLAEEMTGEALQARSVSYSTRLFSSAEELLACISSEDFQPEISVLDIEMGGENGISLAKKLNHLLPGCRIIFLTSYLEYAPDAYEAEHIWFVVKARAKEHFGPAMDKALTSLAKSETAAPGLLIREDGKTVFLPLDEIIYVSRIDRKAFIHSTRGDHSDTRRPGLLIPAGLENAFLRCHQGYWLNRSWIRELDHEEFILKDGMRIPISRTYRDAARAAFFDMFH